MAHVSRRRRSTPRATLPATILLLLTLAHLAMMASPLHAGAAWHMRSVVPAAGAEAVAELSDADATLAAGHDSHGTVHCGFETIRPSSEPPLKAFAGLAASVWSLSMGWDPGSTGPRPTAQAPPGPAPTQPLLQVFRL